jgi:hypothetical protein
VIVVMAWRKDILGQAFEAASARGGGLTAAEMTSAVGSNWQRWLDELKADGWMFREDPRRFGKPGTFRWMVVYAPPAPVVDEGPGEPEQLALLDVSVGARPASALEAA